MALVPLAEARSHVMARAVPTEVIGVDLRDAAGLVLAEDVDAGEDSPPFDNTAVDGFAVRSADVAAAPVTLQVVGTVAAGVDPSVTVGAGEAVRIMTGAPVPGGADAVVMVEDTRTDGDRVRVEVAVAPGQHVRRAGEDLAAGDLAIAAGTPLSPAHVGLLATVGRRRVSVHRRPRVGVISTGDELVDDGSTLRRGQIRDSNRVMLLALCEQSGFEALDLGLVADDEDAIEAALLQGAGRCDALLSSGGVSMGDFDLVRRVLDRIGEMRWMQIAIRPAKPFAFGLVGGTPVFGLPGNPVSSLVSFELLARPALRAMAGDPRPERVPLPAVAGVDIDRRPDGKIHFVRVRLVPRSDGSLEAVPVGAQGSHQLAASASADGLAVVPDGDGIPAGGPVAVLPLD